MAEGIPEKHQLLIKSVEMQPYVYADYVNVNLAYFGFKLAFGSMDLAPAGQRPREVTLSAQVAMSAEHAKSLHDLLGKQLSLYEDRFGPIRPLPTKAEDAYEPESSPKADAED